MKSDGTAAAPRALGGAGAGGGTETLSARGASSPGDAASRLERLVRRVPLAHRAFAVLGAVEASRDGGGLAAIERVLSAYAVGADEDAAAPAFAEASPLTLVSPAAGVAPLESEDASPVEDGATAASEGDVGASTKSDANAPAATVPGEGGGAAPVDALAAVLRDIPPEHRATAETYASGLTAAGWGSERLADHLARIASLAVDQRIEVLALVFANLPAATSSSGADVGAAWDQVAALVAHRFLQTEQERAAAREDLAREVVAQQARKRDEGAAPGARLRRPRVKDASPAARFARRMRERGFRPKRKDGEPLGAATGPPPAEPLVDPKALSSGAIVSGPLPAIDELLALVPSEHREAIAFYLRDLDTGGWSVQERAGHLALLLRLPLDRRANALDYLALLRSGGIDAAVISQHVAHTFLRPPELRTLAARLAGEPGSTGEEGRGTYVTWGGLRVVAAVVERPGTSTKDAALLGGMHEDRARLALVRFEELGLVTRTRGTKGKSLWAATADGVALVFQAATPGFFGETGASSGGFAKGILTTSQGSLSETAGARPSGVLRDMQDAYQQLRKAGMYDRVAHRTVRKYRRDFVMSQILEVQDQARKGNVRDMGKLLYFRFWKKHPWQARQAGLARKVVPAAVREVYQTATDKAPFELALHVAYKLKKMADNGKELSSADVWEAFNDCRKEYERRTARRTG